MKQILAIGIVWLLWFIWFYWMLMSTKQGYENKDGFHKEKEPNE